MTANKPDITTILDAIESGYLNEKTLTNAIANRSDAAAAKVGDNLTDWLIGLGGLLLAVAVFQPVINQANNSNNPAGTTTAETSTTSTLTTGTSAHDALARAFEREAGKPYLPRAGEVPGPYCSFFMWSVFDKVGWTLPTTRQPIDNGLRGQNPGRGLAASWGADMTVGGVNYDASKAKRGQVVVFSGTYGNFGPGAITHVGFIVQDAQPGKPAVMVDKGSSQIIARRSITAVGGQFKASFFPKVPSDIASKFGGGAK